MIKGLRYYIRYAAHRKLFREAGINEQDIFLASFPKSGNTWLRFILARALYPEQQITLQNIRDYFPTVYKSSASEIRRLASPRYIKTHAPFFSLYPKCIYIYRDYRAVVVSGWFHAKNKTGYTGTLSQFISSPVLKAFGHWHWHVNEAFEHHAKNPDKVLLLQYEKLLEFKAPEIERILKFCNITPIISAEEIMQKTSFGKLREVEIQAGNPDKQEGTFFRSGKAEDWRNFLSPEDEARVLTKENRSTMIRCGYLHT